MDTTFSERLLDKLLETKSVRRRTRRSRSCHKTLLTFNKKRISYNGRQKQNTVFWHFSQ